MREQLISKETALLAKEKGFDWDCDSAYLQEDGEPYLSGLRYFDGNGSGLTNNKAIDDHYFGSYDISEESEELPRVISPRSSTVVDIKGICTAPTQSFLQKWLRDVHKIHISIAVNFDNEGDEDIKWYYGLNNRFDNALHNDSFNVINDKYFNIYEEALENALKYALELINNDDEES